MITRRHSVEELFILEFIKTAFSNAAPGTLEQYFKKSRPDALNRLVKQHGLAGFFLKQAASPGMPVKLPAAMLEEWKRCAGQTALQNAMIENESVRIFEYLNRNNVDYALLKGFAYAEELYGGRHLRPVGDLDILIKKNDYPGLKSFLLEKGFSCKVPREFQDSRQKWIKKQESSRNEMGFWKKKGIFTFYTDVHWDIANLKEDDSPLAAMFCINTENWQKQTRYFHIGGIRVKCLSPEKHFVHTVFHFSYGHQFAGIKWLLDICLFSFIMGGGLDWAQIEKAVPLRGCRRLFEITRRMVFGITGPDNPSLKGWTRLYPGTVSRLDYLYFKKRVFCGKSLSDTYISFIFMADTFSGKMRVSGYIFFNRGVSKKWELSGKKVNPLVQPFYIISWGVKEKLRGKS